MTVKKHTPSGAQNSTSARTKNRPADPRDDELTAGRIRTILSNSGVKQSVKGRVQKLVGELYEAGEWDTLPETPEYYGLLFDQTHINNHLSRGTAEPAEREIYDKLAAVIARHEPKAYKVARRCREIYADWLGRKNGRKYADGATYFAEHVDAVLEGGEDGLIPNPDSKYFVPLFVEAYNDRGPRDHHMRKLLDLIRKVDAGADLNALRDEAERERREYAAKHKPKDVRLVERLSAVLADRKRGDDRDAILDTINELSTRTGVSDLHPEIFPKVARELIREARKLAKGRGAEARRLRANLRDLEAIAGE
jgi:hypothetical protein